MRGTKPGTGNRGGTRAEGETQNAAEPAGGRQPVRVCADCGVGVAAQSSFRRAFHFRTSAGRRFVVVGHLCHGCRGRFPNETAAARFLADELPPEIAQADGRT